MAVVDAVVGDHPEGDETPELLKPGLAARRHPIEEDKGLTFAFLVVVDVRAIHINPRHGGPLPLEHPSSYIRTLTVFHRAGSHRVPGSALQGEGFGRAPDHGSGVITGRCRL